MRNEDIDYTGLGSFRAQWHLHNYMMAEVYEATVRKETKVLVTLPSKYLEELENWLHSRGFKTKRQNGQLLIEW